MICDQDSKLNKNLLIHCLWTYYLIITMLTCKADFDMWKLGDWRAKWHVDNFVTQWHIHLLVFWQCVKALLFADKVRTCIDMNAQNNRGDTPLHLASKWGYGEKRFHLNPLFEPKTSSLVTEILGEISCIEFQ